MIVAGALFGSLVPMSKGNPRRVLMYKFSYMITYCT